ncbi:minor tail protein [Mycobacterium phage Job42]|uniref:minor tail protein n=1 Tax=Mycobacterium phage Job42 TaxID=1327771 RepID=UPI0003428FC1|nr:minor tail protein [Mycobacterium phage Job42]AGM61436.1 minor tail protein [Mycobacterium phage Job42]
MNGACLMSWPLNPAGTHYLFEGIVEIPVDPTAGAAILQLRPQGGIGVGVPAIAQGPAGQPAVIDTGPIQPVELEADDPTPLTWSWTELTPPSESGPGVYRLNPMVRKGPKGDDGEAVWDPTDVDPSPVAGQVPVVNSTADGFVLAAQRVGDRYVPASINNTASGNANSTLAQVSIPAQPFDWRPRVQGYTVVTGEGADVRVDLVARLNGESGGNVIGRCPGVAQSERLVLVPGPAAGSSDGFDRVPAGTPATIYFRCERQAGSVTYTTSASTSMFSVEVLPLS